MQGLFIILYPISPHYILSMMKCHFLKALELKHCCASKRKSAVSSVKHPHARWDFSIHCTMGNKREELQFPHNYTIIFHCFQNSQFHFQFREAYEIISKYYNWFYGHFSKFYEMELTLWTKSSFWIIRTFKPQNKLKFWFHIISLFKKANQIHPNSSSFLGTWTQQVLQTTWNLYKLCHQC